jgi:hypothetical protein
VSLLAESRREANTCFATLSAQQFQLFREIFPKLVNDGDRAIALAEFHMKSAALAAKSSP